MKSIQYTVLGFAILAIIQFIPNASAHGVSTMGPAYYVRLDDVTHPSYVTTYEPFSTSGKFVSLVNKDLHVSVNLQPNGTRGIDWLLLDTKPSKVFLVPANSIIYYESKFLFLKAGLFSFQPKSDIVEFSDLPESQKACEPCARPLYQSFTIAAVDSNMVPLKQFKLGIAVKERQCKEGLTSVIRSEDNSSVCVTPQTAQKLIERRWAQNQTIVMYVNSLRATDPVSITINGTSGIPIIPIKRGETKNIDVLIVPEESIIVTNLTLENRYGVCNDHNPAAYCPWNKIAMKLSDISISSQRDVVLTITVPTNMTVGQYPYQIIAKTRFNTPNYVDPIIVDDSAGFDLLVK